jgi:cytochrome P450
MVMHPEFQRKAQAEIDSVIGSNRFPTLADKPSLPYLEALVKEVIRWNPVTPLGKLAAFEGTGCYSTFSKRG